MKFKPLHLLIVLFASFQLCFGQEKPKAEIIDVIGKATCDDLTSRLESVSSSLNLRPNSKAYIITFGDKINQFEKYHREQLIKGYSGFVKINPNRLVFLHGKDKENVESEIWIVPEGANKPVFEEDNWDYKVPQIKKPFIIYNNLFVQDTCPSIFSISFYSQLLIANSNFYGHLVIYEETAKKFRQVEKELLDEIVGQSKVPRNKIKTFYVKNELSDVDFWIVPRKKR